MSTKAVALIMLAVALVAFVLGVIGVTAPDANVLTPEFPDDDLGYYEPQDSCTHWTNCPQRWEEPK